jgi:hypothetical protein
MPDSQLRRRNTSGPRCNHSGSPAGNDIARHSVFWSSPTLPGVETLRERCIVDKALSDFGAPLPQNRGDDSRVGPYGSVMTADLKRVSRCVADFRRTYFFLNFPCALCGLQQVPAGELASDAENEAERLVCASDAPDAQKTL